MSGTDLTLEELAAQDLAALRAGRPFSFSGTLTAGQNAATARNAAKPPTGSTARPRDLAPAAKSTEVSPALPARSAEPKQKPAVSPHPAVAGAPNGPAAPQAKPARPVATTAPPASRIPYFVAAPGKPTSARGKLGVAAAQPVTVPGKPPAVGLVVPQSTTDAAYLDAAWDNDAELRKRIQAMGPQRAGEALDQLQKTRAQRAAAKAPAHPQSGRPRHPKVPGPPTQPGRPGPAPARPAPPIPYFVAAPGKPAAAPTPTAPGRPPHGQPDPSLVRGTPEYAARLYGPHALDPTTLEFPHERNPVEKFFNQLGEWGFGDAHAAANIKRQYRKGVDEGRYPPPPKPIPGQEAAQLAEIRKLTPYIKKFTGVIDGLMAVENLNAQPYPVESPQHQKRRYARLEKELAPLTGPGLAAYIEKQGMKLTPLQREALDSLAAVERLKLMASYRVPELVQREVTNQYAAGKVGGMAGKLLGPGLEGAAAAGEAKLLEQAAKHLPQEVQVLGKAAAYSKPGQIIGKVVRKPLAHAFSPTNFVQTASAFGAHQGLTDAPNPNLTLPERGKRIVGAGGYGAAAAPFLGAGEALTGAAAQRIRARFFPREGAARPAAAGAAPPTGEAGLRSEPGGGRKSAGPGEGGPGAGTGRGGTGSAVPFEGGERMGRPAASPAAGPKLPSGGAVGGGRPAGGGSGGPAVALWEPHAPPRVAPHGAVAGPSVYSMVELNDRDFLGKLTGKYVLGEGSLQVTPEFPPPGVRGSGKAVIEWDAAGVKGEPPATGGEAPSAAGGGKTRVGQVASHAMRALIVPGAKQLAALARNTELGVLFDFGAAQPVEGGIRIPRREPHAPAGSGGQPAAPAPRPAGRPGAAASVTGSTRPGPGPRGTAPTGSEQPGTPAARPDALRSVAAAPAGSPLEPGAYRLPETSGAAPAPRFTPPGERPKPEPYRPDTPAPLPPPQPRSAGPQADASPPEMAPYRAAAPPGAASTSPRYTPPGERLRTEPDRPPSTAPAAAGAVAASGAAPLPTLPPAYLGKTLDHALPSGTPAVYHPVRPEQLPALVRRLEGGVPQAINLPVFARSTGGGAAARAGAELRLAPTLLSGRPAPVIGASAGSSGRYQARKVGPGVVQAVVVHRPAALPALRRDPVLARIFDFGAARPTAEGVYIPRRGTGAGDVGEPGPAPPRELINTSKVLEDQLRRQSFEYLEELFGREAAADFKAGGRLPTFRAGGGRAAYTGPSLVARPRGRGPAPADPIDVRALLQKIKGRSDRPPLPDLTDSEIYAEAAGEVADTVEKALATGDLTPLLTAGRMAGGPRIDPHLVPVSRKQEAWGLQHIRGLQAIDLSGMDPEVANALLDLAYHVCREIELGEWVFMPNDWPGFSKVSREARRAVMFATPTGIGYNPHVWCGADVPAFLMEMGQQPHTSAAAKTPAGIMAHELGHVLQRRGGPPRRLYFWLQEAEAVAKIEAEAEAEAEVVAEAGVAAQRFPKGEARDKARAAAKLKAKARIMNSRTTYIHPYTGAEVKLWAVVSESKIRASVEAYRATQGEATIREELGNYAWRGAAHQPERAWAETWAQAFSAARMNPRTASEATRQLVRDVLHELFGGRKP